MKLLLVCLAAIIGLCYSGADVEKFEVGASPCIEETHCTCENQDGFIDLRPLGKEPNMRVNGRAPTSFTFNPCKAFDFHACKNVLMCEKTLIATYSPVGTTNDVQFITYKGNTALHYHKGNKQATVTLQCAEASAGTVLKFDSQPLTTQHYYFTLSSPDACVNPNITITTTTHGTTPNGTVTTSATTSPTPSNSSTTTTPHANTTATSHTTSNTTATSHTTSNTTVTPKTSHTTSNTTVTSQKTTKTTTPSQNSTATTATTKTSLTPSTPTTPTRPTTRTTTDDGSLLRSSASIGLLTILTLLCRRIV